MAIRIPTIEGTSAGKASKGGRAQTRAPKVAPSSAPRRDPWSVAWHVPLSGASWAEKRVSAVTALRLARAEWERLDGDFLLRLRSHIDGARRRAGKREQRLGIAPYPGEPRYETTWVEDRRKLFTTNARGQNVGRITPRYIDLDWATFGTGEPGAHRPAGEGEWWTIEDPTLEERVDTWAAGRSHSTVSTTDFDPSVATVSTKDGAAWHTDDKLATGVYFARALWYEDCIARIDDIRNAIYTAARAAGLGDLIPAKEARP